MASKLNPYISFKNNAREAMELYKTVFGGKLTLRTFGEAGMSKDETSANNIMHAELIADNGITIMASDTPDHMEYKPGSSNVNVSLSGDDEAELKGYWDKLADGAEISMALAKAPWGDTFGMLTDKFGINWLVNIAEKK